MVIGSKTPVLGFGGTFPLPRGGLLELCAGKTEVLGSREENGDLAKE